MSYRRIAVLMPDYPGAPGRAGYAVGLDVPASVVAFAPDVAPVEEPELVPPRPPPQDLLAQ